MQEGGRTLGIRASTAAVPGQVSESESSCRTVVALHERLVRMMPAFFTIAAALNGLGQAGSVAIRRSSRSPTARLLDFQQVRRA